MTTGKQEEQHLHPSIYESPFVEGKILQKFPQLRRYEGWGWVAVTIDLLDRVDMLEGKMDDVFLSLEAAQIPRRSGMKEE